MGFIKDDLRSLTPENIGDVQSRMTKYSNFISRVIYDMKWYDPPVQTIRNQLFQTDLNEVIQFLVDCVFLRTSTKTENIVFNLQFQKNLPKIAINEYVIWEIFEPIIQNSIDHAGVELNIITITTAINSGAKKLLVTIADNGKGLSKDLLETNEYGIKKLFLESVSTKQMENPNSGYGCYIAYEMCKRCGWMIDAENLPGGGCVFTITINNISET
jgi:light-regulated signal transduction histidine kinase (bacteriophytochrome)